MNLQRLTAIAIALLLVLSIGGTGKTDASILESGYGFEEAFELLRQSGNFSKTGYADKLLQWAGKNSGIGSYEVNPEVNGARYIDTNNPDMVSRLTHNGDSVDYIVSISEPGLYNISVQYLTIDRSLTANIISLRINGESPFDEAANLELPTYWVDESKEFSLDRFGHETIPRSIPVHEWRNTPLYLPMTYDARPLMFYLNSGEQRITVENLANSLALGAIVVEGKKDIPSYDEYRQQNLELPLFSDIITVSAVDYQEKNSSYINLLAEANPDLEPFTPGRKMLNVIDGEGYKLPGQEVVFEIDAPQAGRYLLSLTYSTSKNEAPVYRSVLINGQIPFCEAGLISFQSAGSRYLTKTIGDIAGNPYEFFLNEGKNTLALRAVPGPNLAAVRNLTLCLDHINVFTQQIRRVTGKEIDTNRTWRLSSYIPETADYLEAYITVLQESLDMLAQQWPHGSRSASLADLNIAVKRLVSLAQDPDILPTRLDALQASTGSAAELLGTQIETLFEQPLSVNALYVHGETRPESTRKSILIHISEWLRSFFATFSHDSSITEGKELTVWVNRPVQQVDLIQRMTDSLYGKDTGTDADIKFSHLSDEGRLILAKASGTSPDVVIGLSGWIPYELSIRGAGYDLTSFYDFWTFAADFSPGAFVPLMYDGGVYAMPESMDFQLLFYRKDIIESIGLEIPETWDDVIDILPVLQRNGLGFYHQMAVNSAYKWFNITYVDIAQFNCALYTEDGSRVNLSSPEGIEALDFQSKLFTTYSMPEQVASFYQAFRRGTIPIGIGNFYTYVQLKSAAPEIAGQWGIALLPGQLDEKGTIRRWTPGLATTAFMFADASDPDEAWGFMKWWLSEEIQSDFGYRLQSIFGPTYMWLPANLKAVDAMPVESSDREVIREQLEWIAEPVKTPATYMVERGISDIWNMVVFDGIPVRIAIDRMQIEMNRELRRKLEEFGYIDNGQLVRPYKLPTVDDIKAEMQKNAIIEP